MVLNWLTPQRFNALSEDNKLKIYLKIYDKSVPDAVAEQKIKLDGQLSLSQVIKLAYS
jgi:hypothetical protein